MDVEQTELRKCWNCKRLIDKDPCPMCDKTRAQYSNITPEKDAQWLQQMRENA